MKILVVTQYFWPENFRINDIVLRLKQKGHEVEVFTGLPSYPTGKIFPGWGPFKRLKDQWEEIRITRFPHFPRGNCGLLGMAANFSSFALFGSLLAPFLLKGDYDLVFVYEPSPITVGFPAIVLKKFKKIPIVFWVQDLWPEVLESAGGISNKLVLDIAKAFSSVIYNSSDRVLVTSKAFVGPIVNHGVEPQKVHYYPQYAESFYKPIKVSLQTNEIHQLPEGFKIMFAGNIGVSQSIDTIIQAAEICQNLEEIKWVIVGQGRDYDRVKNVVEQKGLVRTVFLLGQKKPEEMPTLFALADVLLLTLKKDPVYAMTVPAKIQSYMACKKPILAAVDGECANLINDAGAGLVVAAEDSESLAEAAVAMYKATKDEQKEWSRKSYKYYKEHYEPVQAIENLEEHFRQSVQAYREGEI